MRREPCRIPRCRAPWAATPGAVLVLALAGCVDLGDELVVPQEMPPGPDIAVVRVSITVAPDSVEVGAEVVFQAEARNAGDELVPGAAVAWTSSDETRATIDAGGRARGIAPGSVQIRAESGGVRSDAATLEIVALPPNFSTEIQPILSRSCAIAGCHTGSAPTAGLNLSAGQSHAGLVNRPSSFVSGAVLVRPGDAAGSYLVTKLTCTSCPAGTRMPRFAPPLPTGEIDLIRAWIDGGARP